MSILKDKQYINSSNYNARILLHYKFSANKYSWPLWIFDRINKIEGARVLEIGCGNGLLWKLNADKIPETWDIILTDFSNGMLNDAEKNIGNSSHNIKFEVMDAENIPYEDNCFDIIIANHMLYHINDRRKALSGIRRVLKNDGTFYTTTMEKDYMKEMTDIVRKYRSIPGSGKRSNSTIENFSLENGAEQLKEFFDRVDLEIYENSLVITEAVPLTEYAFSLNNITPGRIVINENEKTKFTEFVDNIITREGSIHISSNAGIFISRNGL